MPPHIEGQQANSSLDSSRPKDVHHETEPITPTGVLPGFRREASKQQPSSATVSSSTSRVGAGGRAAAAKHRESAAVATRRLIGQFEAAVHDPQLITNKIRALQNEWDVERVVMADLGIMVLLMTFLGIFWWPMLLWTLPPISILLIQQAIFGWSWVSVALCRFLELRTSCEVHEEEVAWKAIRGDFRNVDKLPVADVIRHSRLHASDPSIVTSGGTTHTKSQ